MTAAMTAPMTGVTIAAMAAATIALMTAAISLPPIDPGHRRR
jgi:hypothetical protein